MSRFSTVPDEELKTTISTAVLKAVKKKYIDFEFTTEFDENGIFHLKHDNYDFLSSLSSGDRIVLWISLLAAVSKSATNNLIFILYRPFYRLHSRERISIKEYLRTNI